MKKILGFYEEIIVFLYQLLVVSVVEDLVKSAMNQEADFKRFKGVINYMPLVIFLRILLLPWFLFEYIKLKKASPQV